GREPDVAALAIRNGPAGQRGRRLSRTTVRRAAVPTSPRCSVPAEFAASRCADGGDAALRLVPTPAREATGTTATPVSAHPRPTFGRLRPVFLAPRRRDRPGDRAGGPIEFRPFV